MSEQTSRPRPIVRPAGEPLTLDDLRELRMAGVTGLEPAASGVTGRRSSHLSYTPGRPLVARAAVMYSTPSWVSSDPPGAGSPLISGIRATVYPG